MAKFGLYAVDNTKDLDLPLVNEDTGDVGFYDNNYDKFKSTKLMYNGSHVHTTFGETNGYGIYVAQKDTEDEMNGKRLIHNGDDIATSNDQSTVFPKQDVQFGDALIAGNKCINITLEDYNRLRGGAEIPGYLRYNSKHVYNIVEEITEDTPEVFYENVHDLDDLTYNSVADEDLLEDNEHLVTTGTTVDVEIPTLVMRHASPTIKAGEGVTIELFVDTKYCTSINEYRIGDTFTVIVEDNEGQEIFRKTVYAGEYIITTAPFKKNGVDVAGHLWYSIRCIDNYGRTSYEMFYDVVVNENRDENLFDMAQLYKPETGDIRFSYGGKNYVITPESDAERGRRDFYKGYHNRKGFQALFDMISANSQYDGIKLYNAKDETHPDVPNSRYYIDYHRPLNPDGTDGGAETSDSFTLPTEYTYYLCKVEFNKYDGHGSVDGLDKDPQYFTEEDFADFKLTFGKKVPTGDGGETRVSTINIFDFIKTDGARIFRKENGKIATMWDAPLTEGDEEYLPYVTNVPRESQRFLKVKSLKAFVNYVTTYNKDLKRYRRLDEFFSEGPGWYYFYQYNSPAQTYDGKRIRHSVSRFPIQAPSNFIIDFNNTGFYSTDWTDSSEKLQLINLQRCINTHLRNGVLDGDFYPPTLKTGFLKCGFIGGHIGENRAILSLGGSVCCSLENMDIGRTFSYCMPMGPNTGSTIRVVYFIYDMTFTDLGIIDSSGNLDDSVVVMKDSLGGSLLMPNAIERDSVGATDICLATTVEFVPVNPYSYNPRCVIVASAKGIEREWCGGKYDIYFIHCYDNNYTYIKTIKTRMYKGVKLPDNAKYMKITGYGVCADDGNGTVTQCIDPYTGDDWNLRVTTLLNTQNASGLVVKNCRIHDTRSTGVTGPATNALYEDCSFERIALTPVEFTLTPFFYDFEESLRLSDGVYFNRCTITDSEKLGYDSTHNHVTTGTQADNITIKNTVGMGLGWGGFDHLCVKDSKLDNYHPGYLKDRGNNFQNILCRTVITDEVYHVIDSKRAEGKNEAGGTMMEVEIKKNANDNSHHKENIERNPCDEPTTLYATYHECVTTPVKVPKSPAGVEPFAVRGKRAVPAKIKGASSPVPAVIYKMYTRIEDQ